MSQALVKTDDGSVYASTAKAYDLLCCLDDVGAWLITSATVPSDKCGKFSRQFVHITCSDTGKRLAVAITISQRTEAGVNDSYGRVSERVSVDRSPTLKWRRGRSAQCCQSTKQFRILRIAIEKHSLLHLKQIGHIAAT